MTSKQAIEEMDRVFKVLGFERGEMQNYRDICEWEKSGFISEAQKAFLLARNRMVAKINSIPPCSES